MLFAFDIGFHLCLRFKNSVRLHFPLMTFNSFFPAALEIFRPWVQADSLNTRGFLLSCNSEHTVFLQGYVLPKALFHSFTFWAGKTLVLPCFSGDLHSILGSPNSSCSSMSGHMGGDVLHSLPSDGLRRCLRRCLPLPRSLILKIGLLSFP